MPSEVNMLKLDDAMRQKLIVKHALAIDQHGDEVLLGLNQSESHFFLAFEEDPVESHPTGEIALYFLLKHKHLKARTELLIER
jgi:hypothetical protein